MFKSWRTAGVASSSELFSLVSLLKKIFAESFLCVGGIIVLTYIEHLFIISLRNFSFIFGYVNFRYEIFSE